VATYPVLGTLLEAAWSPSHHGNFCMLSQANQHSRTNERCPGLPVAADQSI
jgi:hypothetical protein